MTLVIVNSAQYGGSGGSVATLSTHANATEIALHEMGHTAFGFADEYEYYAGCGSGETDHNTYPGGEPVEPNVTADSNRNTLKWRAVLTAPADALPTTLNTNCQQCDPQANPKLANYVGAYAGARYFHCGVYRPSYNCRMRSLGSPFCAVCQKTIRDALTPFLPAAYQGLWWNAPPGSESGWGINFAHQEDTIFATWFTYNAAGNPWWLVMTATKGAGNDYFGTLYETHGPAFSAVPFDPAQVTLSAVGSGTLTFTDIDNGTFAYTVNGISQTKAITRQIFSNPAPTCTFGLQTNLRLATNYQDLWWAWPAGSESGWGVSIAHQGNIIFAAWYTYDQGGAPLWMVVTANVISPNTYSGTLYTTTGPAFSAVPFNPANVTLTAVGIATFTFTNGNSATFAYTVGGISQTKPITRQVFRPPGTVCS
jgi:IgA peptidase M64